MTAVDERAVTETFEGLDVPEGMRAELLRGDIVMTAGPDRVHNVNVLLLERQVPLDRWFPLQTQDIAVPGETSEPQPDLVVVEHGAFEGPGRLVPAPAVTLVVEVVSKNSALRDHVQKRSIYAAGRIPAYLIVDPLEGRCTLLSEPTGTGDSATYKVERTEVFGEPVPVAVLGLDIETTSFRRLPPA
jgi:Uma2 family endonuclease